MRICLFPSDLDGPGCYRVLFPARQLRDQFGVDARMVPYRLISDPETGEAKAFFDLTVPMLDELDADLYVLQQMKQEDVLGAVKHLRQSGKVVVAEADDWYLGTPTYNPGFRSAQPFDQQIIATTNGVDRKVPVTRKTRRMDSGIAQVASRPVNREWMFRIFSEADCLTVSTPALAEGYKRYNRNVHLLRNYLDWEMWNGVDQQYEVDRGGRVRIGWMGRMSYRGGDLAVLRGLIGPWLERNPQVDFVASGDGDDLHDFLGVPPGQRVSYPPIHFRDLGLPKITAVMDVGLVPLEMNRFNDAKSHLKGMEYAACGIPCIASPTDAYREYWLSGGDDGRVGLLARRPKDWLRALDLLCNDHGLRRQMGAAARVKASQHTIQRNAWRWHDLYRGLVGDPPDRGQTNPATRPGLDRETAAA